MNKKEINTHSEQLARSILKTRNEYFKEDYVSTDISELGRIMMNSAFFYMIDSCIWSMKYIGVSKKDMLEFTIENIKTCFESLVDEK